jgi:uncharacterized protein (TIRG00374 family)
MASDRHPAARVFNAIALVVGAVSLVIVLHQLGWTGLRSAVLGTGVWFAVLAAIDMVGSFCDAYAVHGFIRPHAQVSYWRVFAAQISGLAINRLTPGNSLGEPVKVTLLVRAEVPTDVAVSAVVMFNLTGIYVGIAAIAIGVPVTALMLDLPPDIERAVWIALGALLALAILVAWLVRRSAIGTLIDALVTVRILSVARAARWHEKVDSIDGRLRSIGDARTSGLRRGLVGVLGSRVFNWLGTITVLHATGIEMTAPLVIASLTVGILITWLSNIVPLGLGVADGTNYVLYGLLGASPVAGLLFTMVNRLRTVVLALMGLCVMLVATRRPR